MSTLNCKRCGTPWPVDDMDADDEIVTCPECAKR